MAPIQHIDPSELDRMLESGPTTLVDVRTEAEVARGMISGALHIPLNLLPARAPELDPSARIVVYCQSGGRSAQACGWLAEKGYGQVHNLQGGILGWLREGRPLVQP